MVAAHYLYGSDLCLTLLDAMSTHGRIGTIVSIVTHPSDAVSRVTLVTLVPTLPAGSWNATSKLALPWISVVSALVMPSTYWWLPTTVTVALYTEQLPYR